MAEKSETAVAPDVYRVYALRYATHDRMASDNFLFDDRHDLPMPIDYFIWAIVNADRTIIVDTGFDQAAADARGRELIRCPVQALRLLGIDAAAVENVIVTHMHYDHAGNFPLFPNAMFHLQDDEIRFCTGRAMTHTMLRNGYDERNVHDVIGKLFADKVIFHDGDAQIAPGISLHRIGGHTGGLQVVRVNTQRGWLVLASDASHLYANIEKQSPFPIVSNVLEMLEGYRILRELAENDECIIPGHDPLVMRRYAAPNAELDGIIVRLDQRPIENKNIVS